MRSLRDNAIGIFPPQAFEEEIVFRRVFGRRQVIMSRPAGIQHILVDNAANYRRTAAGIRILRPLLGRGLLLSQGEDWRRQRRTLAPAFAPRTLPILARHVARAAHAATVSLEAAGAEVRSTCSRRCNTWRWRSPAPRCFHLSVEHYGAPSCAG